MVLAAAALMAAMIVGASPAMAQGSFGNESDFDNSFDVVQYDGDFYVLDDDRDDCYWGDCDWNDGWRGYGTAELDDCYWWDGEYLCEVDF